MASDFNKLLYQFEMVGQAYRSASQMCAFHDVLSAVGLIDLGYHGNLIT